MRNSRVLWLSAALALVLVCAVQAYGQSDPKTRYQEEVELVDRLAKSRAQYEVALRKLIEFYQVHGNRVRLTRAQRELEQVTHIDRAEYLHIPEVVRDRPLALKSIPAANELYKDGMTYKKHPALFGIGKKDKLYQAIAKFQEIIRDHPDSARSPDAAFMLGEIYAGFFFGEWPTAIGYYENCYKWDGNTSHPARYKAGRIYEKKMGKWDEAAKLYEECIRLGPDKEYREKAAKHVRKLREKNLISSEKQQAAKP